MLDRPAKATRSRPKSRKPVPSLGDVELVTWTTDATFRRARQEWLFVVMREGDAQVLAVCLAVSSYMGAKAGAAWVDQHRLAADLACDVRTIGRRLREAVELGWLRSQRRANTTSVYRMSFSRSRRETVELEHENRMAEFTVESARRRIARDARGSDKSVVSVRTHLSVTFGQECLNGSDTFVGLSSVISSAGDPERVSTERLAETVPGTEADQPEQKKAADEVFLMLGRGDIVVGRQIAASIDPALIAGWVKTTQSEGIVGVAPAIFAARNAALARR